MKRSELFFSFLLLPLDFVMILLAGISAYYLRFAEFATDLRPVIFNLPFESYLKAAAVFSLSWVAVFAISGLYRIKGYRNFAKEISRVALACSAGFMFITVVIFFRRELFDSRFIILAGWALAIVYVSFSRGFVRLIQKKLFRHGIGVHKVVLVGNSKTTDVFMENFSANRDSEFRVVRRLRDFDLDSARELEQYILINEIDEIIQSDPGLNKAEVMRMRDFADEHHLAFRYAADLLGTKVLKTEVSEVAGIPLVEVKRTPLDGWGRIIKRIFDIVFSGLLIIAFSPVMLIAALMIKLDSRGPVFFSRRDDGSFLYRVGQGGKPFKYFKFRSMIEHCDSMRYKELADRNLRDDGPLVKIKDDPRVTRVGKFIRRFSIDELSEFFLVFRGDMSLVGPRPHLPEEVAKYEHHHKKLLTIKPGITGLAQISGRSDLSFEDEVKLDTYYIENWTMMLDFSILLRTPLAVFRHRSAE